MTYATPQLFFQSPFPMGKPTLGPQKSQNTTHTLHPSDMPKKPLDPEEQKERAEDWELGILSRRILAAPCGWSPVPQVFLLHPHCSSGTLSPVSGP